MSSKGSSKCPVTHSDPDAGSRSKSEVLHAHFGGRHLPPDGKIVCPWGIEAALKDDVVYAQMSPSPDEWHSAMFQAIREYRSRRKSVLVVVAPEDPPTHDESRLLASRLFLELSCAFEHHANTGPLPQIKARWRAMYDRLLTNPRAKLKAGAIRGREPQNVVAMGPLYDRPHSRYAPHLCLVSLRIHDILSVTDGGKMEALQAQQRREKERLRPLGVIQVIDEDGDVIILDNEFYAEKYLQISEERYALRLRVLEARGDTGLIEE